MDYLELHAKAIKLVELQQRHDLYYPCDLTRPIEPTTAHWYRLAKNSLCRHLDENGRHVLAALDHKPDLHFMLRLTACASIILSSIESLSGENRNASFEQKINVAAQTLGATRGSSIIGYETMGQWEKTLGEILHDDYKTRQFLQWKEHTISDVVAAMICIEQKNAGLLDRGIYVVDELRLKPQRPHPAAYRQAPATIAAPEYAIAA